MSLSLKLESIDMYLEGKFFLPTVTTGITEAFVRKNQANIYLFKAVVGTLEKGAK